MKKLTGLILSGALLAGTTGVLAPATVDAQRYENNRHNNRYDNGYYNGAYRQRPYDDRSDRDYYNNKAHSGIGPGKGAAIGGAGGAALGALFGGGLKGALIGGAAGAGVGALAGKSAANKRHQKYCDYRDRRC